MEPSSKPCCTTAQHLATLARITIGRGSPVLWMSKSATRLRSSGAPQIDLHAVVEGMPLPRGLVQVLLTTPAHREPDPEGGVLRVRLRHQSTAADRRLEPLLDALNASCTGYLGTDLPLVYEFTA